MVVEALGQMIIGVPKEVKEGEHRVALTPAEVKALRKAGHRVLVEGGAGEGSGFQDEEYLSAGAELLREHAQVFQGAEMLLKIKEPLPSEYPLLHHDLILFCFLHLAAAKELARILQERGLTAIAFETVQRSDGSLPLLAPMSQIAGKMSVQVGAHYLERTHGGKGKLLGGAAGASPGRVVILGAGTVGSSAAQIALGMGAKVTVLDVNPQRLHTLALALPGDLETLPSTSENIAMEVERADLLIGAVLIPGARAPRLVSREMIRSMERGSVVMDISVDQGGCIETCHPTTHHNPVFFVDGVLHYGVPNMPGAVPHTSTQALARVTLPLVIKLADLGLTGALAQEPALAGGVNLHLGKVTHPKVAEALGLVYTPLQELAGPLKALADD